MVKLFQCIAGFIYSQSSQGRAILVQLQRFGTMTVHGDVEAQPQISLTIWFSFLFPTFPGTSLSLLHHPGTFMAERIVFSMLNNSHTQ